MFAENSKEKLKWRPETTGTVGEKASKQAAENKPDRGPLAPTASAPALSP